MAISQRPTTIAHSTCGSGSPWPRSRRFGARRTIAAVRAASVRVVDVLPQVRTTKTAAGPQAAHSRSPVAYRKRAARKEWARRSFQCCRSCARAAPSRSRCRTAATILHIRAEKGLCLCSARSTPALPIRPVSGCVQIPSAPWKDQTSALPAPQWQSRSCRRQDSSLRPFRDAGETRKSNSSRSAASRISRFGSTPYTRLPFSSSRREKMPVPLAISATAESDVRPHSSRNVSSTCGG